jgi:hypothetical protein
VACDGGHSTVRNLLGLPFPGRPGTHRAVLADVELTSVSELVPREPGHFSTLTRRAGGHWAMLVPLGGDRYRLTFGRTDEPHGGAERGQDRGQDPRRDRDHRDEPVAREEIATALRAVYGPGTVLGAVENPSRFTDATRQLERYRVGRVLFAGDAAHIHPPLGGQGLNLGVQDAFDLGWKLAATVRGRAPRGLLDSYHEERHPVAARVLHHTSAQRLLAEPDPGGDAAALRDIVVDLLRLPDANRYVAGLVSGLSLRLPLPGDHPLTGRRVPDADLLTAAGPARVSALLAAGGALLLDLTGAVPEDFPLPPGVGLVRATLPERGGEQELPGAQDHGCEPDLGAGFLGARVLLVRPDGYVAWAADGFPGRGDALLDAIGRIARPTG